MSNVNKEPSMLHKYHISRMSAADIQEYSGWFDDTEIAARMFKPNDKWVDYVTKGDVSAAWSVYADDRLLAHIQSESNPDGSYSVAVAVHPLKRRQGYGTGVLRKFVNEVLRPKGPVYAFIESDNVPSIKTFERVGFVRISDQPDDDSMLKFIWSPIL